MLQATHHVRPEVREHQMDSTGQSRETEAQWHDFHPPDHISVAHPWVPRYFQSIILNDPQGTGLMSTADKEIYGSNSGPIAFRIGNGGAGWTGVLKVLSEQFIEDHGNDFRIAWVVNHSRCSQTALLADVVQVALTYERSMKEAAVREGWCRMVTSPAFWDHFILVGPKANTADVRLGASSQQALQSISKHGALFHSRSDGSATHVKEQALGKAAGIDWKYAAWLRTRGTSPYSALERAEEEGAYLLTDRGTFLTAKKDGVIPSLVVFSEQEEVLLNPCTALINTRVLESPGQHLAIKFAEWLGGKEAQSILREYGRGWLHHMPLFGDAEQQDFVDADLLAHKNI